MTAALQDLYYFCSFALLIQLAMFLLYASRVARHQHSTVSIIKQVAETLTSAVPIAMPAVIVFSLFCCVIKLLCHGIHVHQHLKVKPAADVEVAVFDKTGTLTGNVVSAMQSEVCRGCEHATGNVVSPMQSQLFCDYQVCHIY